MKILPEWPVLSSVINMKEDFKLLPQISTHETLHVDKQVMGAGRSGGLLLAMSVFHLQGRENNQHEQISLHIKYQYQLKSVKPLEH